MSEPHITADQLRTSATVGRNLGTLDGRGYHWIMTAADEIDRLHEEITQRDRELEAFRNHVFNGGPDLSCEDICMRICGRGGCLNDSRYEDAKGDVTPR